MVVHHGLLNYQILTPLMKKPGNLFIKKLEMSLILGLDKMDNPASEFQTQPWQSTNDNDFKNSMIFYIVNSLNTVYIE